MPEPAVSYIVVVMSVRMICWWSEMNKSGVKLEVVAG